MSTIGLWPQRCQCASSFIGMRFPMCRLSDVGDNAVWLTELKLIEVLRDVGKHFSVNAMIQLNSV